MWSCVSQLDSTVSMHLPIVPGSRWAGERAEWLMTWAVLIPGVSTDKEWRRIRASEDPTWRYEQEPLSRSTPFKTARSSSPQRSSRMGPMPLHRANSASVDGRRAAIPVSSLSLSTT